MAARKQDGVTGARLGRRMPVFGVGEHRATVDQRPQTSFVKRLESRQIVEPHLIDGSTTTPDGVPGDAAS